MRRLRPAAPQHPLMPYRLLGKQPPSPYVVEGNPHIDPGPATDSDPRPSPYTYPNTAFAHPRRSMRSQREARSAASTAAMAALRAAAGKLRPRNAASRAASTKYMYTIIMLRCIQRNQTYSNRWYRGQGWDSLASRWDSTQFCRSYQTKSRPWSAWNRALLRRMRFRHSIRDLPGHAFMKSSVLTIETTDFQEHGVLNYRHKHYSSLWGNKRRTSRR